MNRLRNEKGRFLPLGEKDKKEPEKEFQLNRDLKTTSIIRKHLIKAHSLPEGEATKEAVDIILKLQKNKLNINRK